MSDKEHEGYAYEWAEFNLPAEAAYGLCIASPLARRIDAAARREALLAEKHAAPVLADWPATGTAALLVPSFLVRP